MFVHVFLPNVKLFVKVSSSFISPPVKQVAAIFPQNAAGADSAARCSSAVGEHGGDLPPASLESNGSVKRTHNFVRPPRSKKRPFD
jgi:hypothetical protein